MIANGIRSHGHDGQAGSLEDRILRGCAEVGSFPEFFRGDEGGTIRINTGVDVIEDGVVNRLEQPPQMIQGWTVTRVWRILRYRGMIGR